MKLGTQHGYVYEKNGAFHIRYYVYQNSVRNHRSRVLCKKDDTHPSKDAPAVIALAEEFIVAINNANATNDSKRGNRCPHCGNRRKRRIQQKIAPKV